MSAENWAVSALLMCAIVQARWISHTSKTLATIALLVRMFADMEYVTSLLMVTIVVVSVTLKMNLDDDAARWRHLCHCYHAHLPLEARLHLLGNALHAVVESPTTVTVSAVSYAIGRTLAYPFGRANVRFPLDEFVREFFLLELCAFAEVPYLRPQKHACDGDGGAPTDSDAPARAACAECLAAAVE